MKIKRSILIIFTFLILVSSISAVDFGFTLFNSTGILDENTMEFQQTDRLTAWFRVDLEPYVNFLIQGNSVFSYNNGITLSADIERFRLTGNIPSEIAGPTLFSFAMGRIQTSDFSGKVLSHVVDGIRFKVTYPKALVTITAGYTGLLLNPSSSIILNNADATASANREDYLLGSPRIIGNLQILFPEIITRQDLKFSLVAQEDLRPLIETGLPAEDRLLIEEGEEEFTPGKGGPVDTQYVGIGLSGAISNIVYYNSFFYLGTGRMLSYLDDSSSGTGSSYQYTQISSFLTGGGIRLFFKQFLLSRIALDFVYASGDGDQDATSIIEGNVEGSYGTFTPIAGSPASLVFIPEPSNIMYGQISYSLKPLSQSKSGALQTLQTMLLITPYFRSAEGPISEPTVDPGSANTNPYLGTEIDAIINLRPFSDLGIGLQGGIFLPTKTTGIFVAGSDTLRLLAKLNLSFSF